MSKYEEIIKLAEDLISLMKDPACTDIKWNNKVRKTIQEIAEQDDMCMFSTLQNLREKFSRQLKNRNKI